MQFQDILQNLINWSLSSGIKIVFILLVAFLLNRFAKSFIRKLIIKGVKDGSKEATEKRQKTLIMIFSGALRVFIYLAAIMMVVSELGINIGPVLAGAGILGVALGFGAQYVVRDFLAGLFIILENQYRVGDVICLDGTCGSVENIDLRKTVLRDLDGTVHFIPNGSVKKSSNLSKRFAKINLDVKVAYKEDLEKVIRVINKVGEDLANDPEWRDSITEAPKFLRVNDLADSGIVIKILGETEPLKQWGATGELRKRIKIAFDKEGIEIPFPQMSVWSKSEKKNKKR
jgi:moderate conductance mechanosensitive channel